MQNRTSVLLLKFIELAERINTNSYTDEWFNLWRVSVKELWKIENDEEQRSLNLQKELFITDLGNLSNEMIGESKKKLIEFTESLYQQLSSSSVVTTAVEPSPKRKNEVKETKKTKKNKEAKKDRYPLYLKILKALSENEHPYQDDMLCSSENMPLMTRIECTKIIKSTKFWEILFVASETNKKNLLLKPEYKDQVQALLKIANNTPELFKAYINFSKLKNISQTKTDGKTPRTFDVFKEEKKPQSFTPDINWEQNAPKKFAKEHNLFWLLCTGDSHQYSLTTIAKNILKAKKQPEKDQVSINTLVISIKQVLSEDNRLFQIFNQKTGPNTSDEDGTLLDENYVELSDYFYTQITNQNLEVENALDVEKIFLTMEFIEEHLRGERFHLYPDRLLNRVFIEAKKVGFPSATESLNDFMQVEVAPIINETPAIAPLNSVPTEMTSENTASSESTKSVSGKENYAAYLKILREMLDKKDKYDVQEALRLTGLHVSSYKRLFAGALHADEIFHIKKGRKIIATEYREDIEEILKISKPSELFRKYVELWLEAEQEPRSNESPQDLDTKTLEKDRFFEEVFNFFILNEKDGSRTFEFKEIIEELQKNYHQMSGKVLKEKLKRVIEEDNALFQIFYSWKGEEKTNPIHMLLTDYLYDIVVAENMQVIKKLNSKKAFAAMEFLKLNSKYRFNLHPSYLFNECVKRLHDANEKKKQLQPLSTSTPVQNSSELPLPVTTPQAQSSADKSRIGLTRFGAFPQPVTTRPIPMEQNQTFGEEQHLSKKRKITLLRQ